MSALPAEAAARELLRQIESVLLQAEQAGQTADVDPHRAALFELFAMADAMGCLSDDAEPDLSAEGVARRLAERWNMARDLGGGVLQPSRLPPGQQARLRTLMAFMRMWSEWTYAWQRHAEFHPAATSPPACSDDDDVDEDDDL